MIGGSEKKEYSYSESDAPEMFDKLLEKWLMKLAQSYTKMHGIPRMSATTCERRKYYIRWRRHRRILLIVYQDHIGNASAKVAPKIGVHGVNSQTTKILDIKVNGLKTLKLATSSTLESLRFKDSQSIYIICDFQVSQVIKLENFQGSSCRFSSCKKKGAYIFPSLSLDMHVAKVKEF